MTQTGRERAHAAPCAATAATLDRYCVWGVPREQRMRSLTLPNVRAEAGPTAKRQARAVENAPAHCAGLAFCCWASPRARG